MNIAKRFLILFSVVIVMAACRGGRQQATPPPGGTLSLERDDVEHGANLDDLAALEPDTPVAFEAGDFIRVQNGGQALLDFADNVSLRIFDDTELEILVAEFGEDVPLEFQIALTDGDITGELTEEGGEVVFTTPTGAEITVLGTEFFISYNPASEEMAVGNFDGTLNVRTPGMSSASSVGDGDYVTWTPGSSLSDEKLIPTTYEDFQNRTDDMGGIPEVLAETQTCVDDAYFVGESNDPPGGRYPPGQRFTMEWTIENSGDCLWTEDYQVQVVSGETDYAEVIVPLPAEVASGESVQVMERLTAPEEPGSYRINWQMVNADDEPFGDIWTTRFIVVAPTATPTPVYTPMPTATLPPPEGVLVYSFGDGEPGLATAAADGRTVRYLELSGEGPDLGLEGRLMAYSGIEYIDELTIRGQVYLYDFDFGQWTNLSEIAGTYDALDPAISPAGDLIAYASHSPELDPTGVYEIHYMDIFGEPYGQLTYLDMVAREPDWSPDGKTVVFTAGTGLTRNMYRVSIGGEAQAITNYRSGQVRHPQVSPDGTRIVFSYRTGPRAPDDIYLLTFTNEGPDIQQLTKGGDFFGPTWSPDGQYLALSGPNGIYIMPADGSQTPQLLVKQAEPGTASWGPTYIGITY